MGIEKQIAVRIPMERKIFGYREAKAVRIPKREKTFGYREAKCSKNYHFKIRLYTQVEKCDWV